MENPYCSGHGLQLQSLWRTPAVAVMAYSCNPYGEPQLQRSWLTAAIPMENPCCSGHGLQLLSLWITPTAAVVAYSCNPCGEPLLQLQAGESWFTAAIPMENPCCSGHGLQLQSLWITPTV